MQLRIENPGVEPLEFCAGLHTYLGVADIRAVRVEGLRGTRYRDRTRQDREAVDDDHALTIAGEVDRIYLDAPHELVLRESGRSMRVRAHSFPDVVVWNPWKDKCASLDDLRNDACQNMLCVEAVVVGKPIALASRGSWTGGQTLMASHSRQDVKRARQRLARAPLLQCGCHDNLTERVSLGFQIVCALDIGNDDDSPPNIRLEVRQRRSYICLGAGRNISSPR